MSIRTILIDDEPLARQVMREFLQAFPQVEIVAECENGKQAVAAINRHKPELIFLRVHRSAIINLARISHLEKDGEGGMQATMASGEQVKISRKYAAALRGRVV